MHRIQKNLPFLEMQNKPCDCVALEGERTCKKIKEKKNGTELAAAHFTEHIWRRSKYRMQIQNIAEKEEGRQLKHVRANLAERRRNDNSRLQASKHKNVRRREADKSKEKRGKKKQENGIQRSKSNHLNQTE
jgi:hypothetical protein